MVRQRGRGFGKALTSSVTCCSPRGALGDSLAPVSPYKPRTRGPLRAHPWPYEFTMELRIGTPHSFRSWPASQARTLLHSHMAQYFHPAPYTRETWFHPNRQLLVVSGRWSDSPSAFWGRPEFEPGFLPVQRAVFLNWFLSLSGFLCAADAFALTHWKDKSFLGIKLSIGTWWDLLPVVLGMHPGAKGRW
jgi:hypothetical protein